VNLIKEEIRHGSFIFLLLQMKMCIVLSIPHNQSDKKMKWILVIQVMLALVGYAYCADADQLPTAIEYRLDLKIDYSTKKLYGTCEITFSNGADSPMEHVPILLYRLLSVNSVENENSTTLPYTQKIVSISGWEKIQVNYIEIGLEEALLPGEQSTIELEYEGYLFGYSADGWRYVKDNIDRNFTMIRTDGYGYPVIAFPNEKDMMPAQVRHDYTIRVTVPDGLKVVTGGKLIEQSISGDQTTFTFRSKKPSWRMDIAISDYHLFEDGENRVYYFASDSLGAQKAMQAMQASFDLYTSWFGPLDNYLGYSIIEVPEGYGSQYDVTATTLSAGNLNESKDMNTIYHEIAHSWNVNNLDPQPCRFESEGFARFLEFLLLEKIDKREHAVSNEADRYLDRIRSAFNEHEEYQNVAIKDYGVNGMTNYSYSMGMVVFAIFYDLGGEEQFNRIIGSFYAQYHSKGATMDEFIKHCLEIAGPDLERFFNDWIYTTHGIQLVMEGKTLPELIQVYKEI
jgi:aminopeptidase N